MIRRVKGTKDILQRESIVYNRIIEIAQEISCQYGFMPFHIPILEYSELFSSTLGVSSDIVSKEMYTFVDKSEKSMTLRPEFTAGIMRAVITENVDLPARLFSHGPLFRYDRPQAGRQRQFHQLNFEHLGSTCPESDVELISMLCNLFKELGILSKIQLRINSLGCENSRKQYKKELIKYFEMHHDALSDDSKKRLSSNPLRILDSKHQLDQSIIQDVPCMSVYYTDESQKTWYLLRKYLDKLSIKYTIDHTLVRGLAYYNHTVFEFVSNDIGAQTAIAGGGRYDGLANIIKEGRKISAVGSACGIERLMMLCDNKIMYKEKKIIVIMPILKEHYDAGLYLAENMRNDDLSFSVLLEVEGKLQNRMKKANFVKAKYIIFLGKTEIETKKYTIKDLDLGIEKLLTYDEMVKFLL